MVFQPGPWEIMLIIGVAVLLFGAAKLPQLARSMGKSMGEFKKAQREAEIELSEMEKEIKEGKYKPGNKRSKLEKIAGDLGIEYEGLTDEELIEEINKAIPKTEKAEP